MFLLFLGAQVSGRSYDTFCALAFAAVALLWEKSLPVLGRRIPLFLCCNPWRRVGRTRSISYEKKGMGALRGKIFAAWAVWFTTLPLVAWYFYEIPVYAVFVNLLMLPMMGVLLGFGAAGGMVGLLSLPLAKGMLFPCREFCSLWGSIYVRLPVCFRVPCGFVGRPQCWQIAVYYAFLGAGTCLVRRQREQREKGKGTRQEGRAKEWRASGRFPCRTIAACRIGSSAERGGGTGYAGCRAGGRLLSADEGGLPPVCRRRKFQCRKGGHLSDSAVSKGQRSQKD